MIVSDEKAKDFAIAVYNDCRAEIRDRLGYRDQWIGRYSFGVVAFLGVALGIDDLTPETRFYLCLVMPVMSLIVAYNVKAHVDAVERLADFLRIELAQKLSAYELTSPFWDEFTARKRETNAENERLRNEGRLRVHLISLHGPSAISLLVASVILLRDFRPAEMAIATSVPPTAMAASVAAVGWAVEVTRRSFKARRARLSESVAKTNEAEQPQGASEGK